LPRGGNFSSDHGNKLGGGGGKNQKIWGCPNQQRGGKGKKAPATKPLSGGQPANRKGEKQKLIPGVNINARSPGEGFDGGFEQKAGGKKKGVFAKGQGKRPTTNVSKSPSGGVDSSKKKGKKCDTISANRRL